MGGQVLGGGVIALIAVLLWLVYLLPSWHSRHQFNAAERNAVRLNQALRILAETSETPEEVRLELNARTALAQQRLAKRAAAEREHAELEAARAQLDEARAEREAARAARAAARATPAARRSRARRRARLTTTFVGLAAIAVAGWGGWMVVMTGSQIALWSGVTVAAVCGLLLRRMARVGARAVVAAQPAAVPVAVSRTRQAVVQDLVEDRTWTPRTLPHPLASAAGSMASVELDTVEAQRALRAAAREEAMRARAERLRPAPPDIAAARAAREEAAVADHRALAQGGPADDAEIEAHVRQLLARRAAG